MFGTSGRPPVDSTFFYPVENACFWANIFWLIYVFGFYLTKTMATKGQMPYFFKIYKGESKINLHIIFYRSTFGEILRTKI